MGDKARTANIAVLIAKHVLEAALLTRNASFPIAVLRGCLADLSIALQSLARWTLTLLASLAVERF